MKNIYQHGEIILYPVSNLPKGDYKLKKRKDVMIARSETHHHHLLEATKPMGVVDQEDYDLHVIVRDEPASLVHKKLHDFHPTLTVVPGIYKKFQKYEYRPWDQVIRQVQD